MPPLEVYLDDGKTLAFSSQASVGQVAAMPLELSTLPIVSKVRACLQDVGPEAVRNFITVIEFEALRNSPGEFNFVDKPVSQLVDIFLDEKGMTRTMTEATIAFKNGDEPANFMGARAFSILQKCFQLIDGKTVMVDVLLTGEAASVGKDEVQVMCSLLCVVHEIAAAFLYLAGEVKQPEACLRKHELRADLLDTLDFAEHKCDEGFATIDSDSNIFLAMGASPVCWAMPAPAIKRWLQGARSLVAEFRSRFYRQCVLDTQRLALVVEKRTPKYDHFCNDKTLAQQFVKRLMQHSFKDDLPHDVLALYQSMSQAGAISVRFGLLCPREDPATKELMEHADITFSAGKKAVAVTASANILWGMTGQQQKDEAEAMVKKRGGLLPKALLAELEAKLPATAKVHGLKRKASAAQLDVKA